MLLLIKETILYRSQALQLQLFYISHIEYAIILLIDVI